MDKQASEGQCLACQIGSSPYRLASETLWSSANIGKLDFHSFPHHARRDRSGVFHLVLAIDSKRPRVLDNQGTRPRGDLGSRKQIFQHRDSCRPELGGEGRLVELNPKVNPYSSFRVTCRRGLGKTSFDTRIVTS